MKIIKNLLMIKAGVIVLLFSLFANFANAESEEKISPAQFLKFVRTPPQQKTWAQLQGEIINMKRNKEGKRLISKADISLAIRFSSEMIFAQVIIGKDEIYSVGQPYSMLQDGATVSKSGDMKSTKLRGTFGIKPEDLTMSFIFWSFAKELPSTSIRMISCRVFLLISPDKKESAKVYISRNHYFPIKVEWSKALKDKPFGDILRTLEVVSFKEVNKLYLVKTLKFYGPGWRTNISFTKTDAGKVKDGTPKKLFRKK